MVSSRIRIVFCLVWLTPSQDIVVLVRPSSVEKPGNKALKQRGVDVRGVDLQGPQEELVKVLEDIDIVVSAIGPQDQVEQIPLATAAKTASVKRSVPCGFMTVSAAGGVMDLRDEVCEFILISCLCCFRSAHDRPR